MEGLAQACRAIHHCRTAHRGLMSTNGELGGSDTDLSPLPLGAGPAAPAASPAARTSAVVCHSRLHYHVTNVDGIGLMIGC